MNAALASPAFPIEHNPVFVPKLRSSEIERRQAKPASNCVATHSQAKYFTAQLPIAFR